MENVCIFENIGKNLKFHTFCLADFDTFFMLLKFPVRMSKGTGPNPLISDNSIIALKKWMFYKIDGWDGLGQHIINKLKEKIIKPILPRVKYVHTVLR